MASINLNGKRRRVEHASSGLSKPFKSPLLRPPQTPENESGAGTKENEVSSSRQASQSSSTRPESTPAQPLDPTTPLSRFSTRASFHLPTHPPSKRNLPSSHLTPPRKPILSDPAVLDLQKQQRALQTRLVALRSELDTAQQALRIESSNKTADLEALIAKWRSVSQSAAEEVFAGAQERVSRMGGMKAWKERMRTETAQWEREEMEAWYGDGEAEEFEVDRDELERRKAEMSDRVEVSERKEDPKEMEDEEFTMEVMLKTLNVDLKVIGRRGTECLPVKSNKDGEDITVPLKYLKYLESRVAELEDGPNVPKTSPPVRDMGVQTDPVDEPHHAEDMSLDKLPLNRSPGGWRVILHQLLLHPGSYPVSGADQYRGHASGPAHDLVLLPDPRTQPQRLEEPLISRLAYEIYQDDMSVDQHTGSPHTLAFTGELSSWLEEIYTNVYYSVNHWVWPFIDWDTWRSWRQEWSVEAETDQWKGFFVQMVYAVGALSCNAFQPDHGHSMRAAEFYTSALVYYPFVMEHPSTILQIQASIFMILYALQCPSSEEMATTVSSIVPFCIASMAEIRKHASSNIGDAPSPTIGTDGIITESLFITCYMLNEIVVSGWERPVSAAYRAIDDDIYTLGNEMPSSSGTSKALRHLFKLRKIQSNIRRHWDESPPQQESSDSLLKSELTAWREEIPRYSIGGSPSTYLHPLWMANLYDYSIIILMQEKRRRLKDEDIEDILSASVEVCLNFRRLQEEGQVMCYTWSAVSCHCENPKKPGECTTDKPVDLG
ncbi:hypothetical protein BJX96DRAFT_166446 [Aspergillus floccosus]